MMKKIEIVGNGFFEIAENYIIVLLIRIFFCRFGLLIRMGQFFSITLKKNPANIKNRCLMN